MVFDMIMKTNVYIAPRRNWAYRVVVSMFTLVLAISLVGISPATPADAAWIGNLTNITSVVAEPSAKRIRITYENSREIPSQVGISATTGYGASKRAGSLGYASLSRAKGKHTSYVSTGNFAQVVSVDIRIPRVGTSTYYRLMTPSRTTSKRVVSSLEAMTAAISPYVAGTVLTYVPQTRLIKVAGATVLGWSIFSDVKASLTASGNTCPKLKVGQVVHSEIWYTQSGKSVRQNLKFKMWHNSSDYAKGKTPICSQSSSHVYS